MSDESSSERPVDRRNIQIHLSDAATLKAVRTDGGFDILVGDDVVIRGVNPDHMRTLVGSVMDAFLPADMATRLLNGWGGRRRRRTSIPQAPEVNHDGEPRQPE
ncbi:MAG: hypothetical protein ACRDT4_18235 [Micromonosporaceae bacterium]